jgi:hypothetical protein
MGFGAIERPSSILVFCLRSLPLASFRRGRKKGQNGQNNLFGGDSFLRGRPRGRIARSRSSFIANRLTKASLP